MRGMSNYGWACGGELTSIVGDAIRLILPLCEASEHILARLMGWRNRREQDDEHDRPHLQQTDCYKKHGRARTK
jgi:hypothetical protein